MGRGGWSWWDPTQPSPPGVPNLPRLFTTIAGAKNAATMWVKGKVKTKVYEDDVENVIIPMKGRRRSDFEIIHVKLVPFNITSLQ